MMTVRAVEKGTGRVRTGRIGGGSGSGGVAPAFQADFTALSALPPEVSFSRASNAMVTDSTGKLTYAPNNLLLQSNNFGDAAWTKSNATVSSGVADPLGGTNATTITATGANAEVFQSIATPPLGNYISAIWVRRRTGTGNVSLYTPRTDTTVGLSITSTWTLFSTNGSIATGNGFCDFVIATSGDAIDVYAATLSRVTYETAPRSADQVITTSAAYYGPRFDHTWNGSAWVATGLLIEEQRTNLLLQSNNITDAVWSVSYSNVTATTGTSDPFGGTSATTLTAVGSPSFMGQAVTTGAVTVTNSTWIRRRTGVATITLTAPDGTDTVLSLTGSWQRLSLSAASAGTSYFYLKLNSVGDAIDICNSQMEPGSFATSYIPTTTAAVTRSADIAQLTGAADTAAKATSGTIIIEFGELPFDRGSSNSVLIASTNYFPLFRTGASNNRIASFAFHDSSTSVYAGTMSNPTLINRAGVAHDGTSSSISLNGGAVQTGTGTEDWAADGTIYIGVDSAGAESLDGHIRSIAIYSSRLSDADLQTKSVVGAAF